MADPLDEKRRRLAEINAELNAELTPKAADASTSAPQPAEKIGDASGMLRSLAQGATMSGADELNALRRSLSEDRPYRETFAEEQQKLRAYNEERPGMSTAGEIAGGLLLPASAAAFAGRGRIKPLVSALQNLGPKKKLGVFGGAAATGTTLGGTSGYMAGDDPDMLSLERADNALVPAIAGGTLSVAAPLARPVFGPLASSLSARFGDQVAKGREAALRAMSSDGMSSLDDLRAFLRKDKKTTGGLGESMIADYGPRTTGLAETTVQYGTKQGDELTKKLAGRINDARENVANTITHRMLPKGRNFYDDEQKLIKSLRGPEVARLYNKAYVANPSIRSDRLETLLQRLEASGKFSEIMDTARTLAALGGHNLGPLDKELSERAGTKVANFSLETWDHLKRGLDGMLYDGSGKYANQLTGKLNPVGGKLNDVRHEIVTELDALAGPAYKAARNKYKGDAEVLEALRLGKDDAVRMAPKQLKAFLSDASDAEKDAVRVGLAEKLHTTILDNANNINAAKKVIGAPRMRERLTMLADDPQDANLLLAALDRQLELFNNASRVVGNSATARRMTGVRMFEDGAGADPSAVEGALNIIGNGSVPGIVSRMLRVVGSKLPIPEKKANEVARILKAGSPAEVDSVIVDLEAQLWKSLRSEENKRSVERAIPTAIQSVSGPTDPRPSAEELRVPEETAVKVPQELAVKPAPEPLPQPAVGTAAATVDAPVEPVQTYAYGGAVATGGDFAGDLGVHVVEMKHGGPVNPAKPSPKPQLTREQLMEAIKALAASGVLPKRKFADGGFAQSYNSISDPDRYLNYGSTPFAQFTQTAMETPAQMARTGAGPIDETQLSPTAQAPALTQGALTLDSGGIGVGNIGDPAGKGTATGPSGPSSAPSGPGATGPGGFSWGSIGGALGTAASAAMGVGGLGLAGSMLGAAADVANANNTVGYANAQPGLNAAPIGLTGYLSALANALTGLGTSAKDQAFNSVFEAVGNNPAFTGPNFQGPVDEEAAIAQDKADREAAAEAAAAQEALDQEQQDRTESGGSDDSGGFDYDDGATGDNWAKDGGLVKNAPRAKKPTYKTAGQA